MKNILVIITCIFLIYSCEEKEIIEAAPQQQQDIVNGAKSMTVDESIDPDKTYTWAESDFVDNLVNVLNDASVDDVITAELAPNDMYKVDSYYGMGPFWWDPNVIQAKEICKGKSGLGFGRCVKGYVDAGHKVTVWKDGGGNYHAEIPD